MERLAEHFGKKGVPFLHALSGESRRTGLDYQKHYRSRIPHVLDADLAFQKGHRGGGWPFYLIVDAKGRVVYARSTLLSRDFSIPGRLAKVALGRPVETVRWQGVDYLATTAKNNGLPGRGADSAPDLAVIGKSLVATYVRRSRTGSEVNLSRPGSREDLLVSSPGQDAYDAVVTTAGKDGGWVFWTGLADSGRYDVFGRRFAADGELSSPLNLTRSEDDAMSPAAAPDGGGGVWLTYYRWHKMGLASRDKEVYARRFDGRSWHDEIRLSPEDLPAYEDHTDPAIAAAPDGSVVVAWSWDMHKSDDPVYRRYQTRYHAEAPTIFGRRVTARGGRGDLMFLGEAGVDGSPTLAFGADGRLWCAWSAWSSSGSMTTRSLVVSVTAANGKDREDQQVVSSGAPDIGIPRLLVRGKTPTVVWSERDAKGVRTLRSSRLEDGWWTKPEILVAEGKPRCPRVAVVSANTAWLAFIAGPAHDRQLVLRKLPK